MRFADQLRAADTTNRIARPHGGASAKVEWPGAMFVRLALIVAALTLVGSDARASDSKALPSGQADTQAKDHILRRRALIIGNGAYEMSPLLNPAHDAAAVASTLHTIGFSTDLQTEVSSARFESSIDRFVAESRNDDINLFFFAGHGFQLDGQDYLLGVDFRGSSREEARRQAIPLDSLVERLQQNPSAVNVVVIDTCRNDPFGPVGGKARTRGLILTSPSHANEVGFPRRGLAPVWAAAGTIVVFSTAPGVVAMDGNGPTSIFTERFILSLRQPRVDVDTMFFRLVADVREATKGEQVPWVASNVLGKVFLNDTSPSPLNSAAENVRPVPKRQPRRTVALQIVCGEGLASKESVLRDLFASALAKSGVFKVVDSAEARILAEQATALNTDATLLDNLGQRQIALMKKDIQIVVAVDDMGTSTYLRAKATSFAEGGTIARADDTYYKPEDLLSVAPLVAAQIERQILEGIEGQSTDTAP